jgi:hypothetical protein
MYDKGNRANPAQLSQLPHIKALEHKILEQEKNRCNKRTKNVNFTSELLGLSCKIEVAHLTEV